MTETPSAEPLSGPILLCAGTDAAAAARLAEAATELLDDRAAVVLATWRPPSVLSAWDVVMDDAYDTQVELRAAARQAAVETAQAAADVLEAHGVHVTRQVCPEELAPWREILALADEVDAAAIVAGIGEGHALQPGGLGRQARALAHRSRRPILFVPAEHAPASSDAPAIFAYDGSPPADAALRAGSALLRRRPALVATAWLPARYAVGVARIAVPDEVVRKGADALDESARLRAGGEAAEGAAQLAATGGWSCEQATLGTARNVTSALVRAAAEHDAAVVVTGTRGRSALAATLLGSTAEGVLRHAGRPVLLVPSAKDAA